jgi:hypothetical protein
MFWYDHRDFANWDQNLLNSAYPVSLKPKAPCWVLLGQNKPKQWILVVHHLQLNFCFSFPLPIFITQTPSIPVWGWCIYSSWGNAWVFRECFFVNYPSPMSAQSIRPETLVMKRSSLLYCSVHGRLCISVYTVVSFYVPKYNQLICRRLSCLQGP